MGKPLAIPRILGINWWSLLVISLFESYARYLFRVPHWVPEIWEFWMLGQALWLRLAEPQSIALYLYLAAAIVSMPSGEVYVLPKTSNGFSLLFRLFVIAAQVTAIFRFRYEMVKHFKETDPCGIELDGVMTFFFNVLYFQYWFHEIYLEQQQTLVEAETRLN